MRIVVTGAAGFIGSHLSESLLADGHEIVGVDNFDDFYEPERKRRNLATAMADSRFEFAEADIRNTEAVRSALVGADSVVHLAARPGVRPSFARPDAYAQANVVGTATLLEVLTSLEITRLIFISSSSVYGEGAQSPFREDGDTGVPKSPYAATKLAGEALCRTFSHCIAHIAVLRLFSVYGPRQRPDLALQTFARCIQAGEPIPILGPTSSYRDYTYVDDIVSGIKQSLRVDEPWLTLNLGSGSPVTLEEMITGLEQALGRQARRNTLAAHPGDLFGTWADVRAAEETLGFRPQWTFERGVRAFVEWFLAESGAERGAPSR